MRDERVARTDGSVHHIASHGSADSLAVQQCRELLPPYGALQYGTAMIQNCLLYLPIQSEYRLVLYCGAVNLRGGNSVTGRDDSPLCRSAGAKTRRPAPNDNEYEVTNPGSAGLVWRPKEPGRGQGAKSSSPSSMFHPPFRPPCPSSVLLASSAPRVCLSTPARMACMCGGDDGTCLHHGPRAPPPLPGRDSIAMACGCSSGPPLPDHNKMSRPREWERRHRGHCSTGRPAKSPSRARLSSGRVSLDGRPPCPPRQGPGSGAGTAEGLPGCRRTSCASGLQYRPRGNNGAH